MIEEAMSDKGKCSVFSILCSDRKGEGKEDLPWAENRDWQRLRCLYLLSAQGREAGNSQFLCLLSFI